MIKLNSKQKINAIFVFCVLLLTFFSKVECAVNVSEAEEEFKRAWNNPSYTQIRQDDVDINKTLAKYYKTPYPVNFTRQMLWDMETKKAWDPKTYLEYVVRDGKSWGKKFLENGNEMFVRSSQQKQWLNGEVYEEVFEKVYLNHKAQKATFLGTQYLTGSAGEKLQLNNKQPLFHVQHSVEGEENNPINVWRIVHLTDKKDQNLIDHFNKLNNPTVVPGFIEIYIKKDLQTPISHK
ncbi:MAG: hypothetical protein H0X29_05680 [Parachlamydiaceae bacterium]|nr:hypothetical protein [Parachlamydiaceae bacterium]